MIDPDKRAHVARQAVDLIGDKLGSMKAAYIEQGVNAETPEDAFKAMLGVRNVDEIKRMLEQHIDTPLMMEKAKNG